MTVTTYDAAYEVIECNGKPLDRATTAAIREAEKILGYSLTIVQGIGGASASAGTHTVGRAVDLSPYDWENKVRVLKDLGFAVWHREEIPGLWGEHIHGVLILNSIDNSRGIAPAAFRQIGSFLRGRNGLADDGPDETPWRSSPQPVFKYPVPKEVPPVGPKPPTQNKVTRARDALSEAYASLGTAAALLDDVNEKREAVKSEIAGIRKTRRGIKETLDRMPKR